MFLEDVSIKAKKEHFKEQVIVETKEDPIMFGEMKMKKLTMMKYQGDMLHEDGQRGRHRHGPDGQSERSNIQVEGPV